MKNECCSGVLVAASARAGSSEFENMIANHYIARAAPKKVAVPAVAKKVAKKAGSKKVKKTAAKKGGKTGKKVAKKAVKKVAAPKK
jgi:hypothetical protein